MSDCGAKQNDRVLYKKPSGQEIFDEYVNNWHEHTGESVEQIKSYAIVKEYAEELGVQY